MRKGNRSVVAKENGRKVLRRCGSVGVGVAVGFVGEISTTPDMNLTARRLLTVDDEMICRVRCLGAEMKANESALEQKIGLHAASVVLRKHSLAWTVPRRVVLAHSQSMNAKSSASYEEHCHCFFGGPRRHSVVYGNCYDCMRVRNTDRVFAYLHWR